jgi:hypothetical protein
VEGEIARDKTHAADAGRRFSLRQRRGRHEYGQDRKGDEKAMHGFAPEKAVPLEATTVRLGPIYEPIDKGSPLVPLTRFCYNRSGFILTSWRRA